MKLSGISKDKSKRVFDLSKVIIGIHGLGNKPPANLLESWWKKSIHEGLSRLGHPRSLFKFELVYWAKYIHPQALDPAISDPKDPLFLAEPYQPVIEIPKKVPDSRRKRLLDYLEKQMDRLLLNEDLTINFASISDLIIHHFFRDLELYYSSEGIEATLRHKIQAELHEQLVQHRHDDVLVLAHSMGSIIAYEVLQQLPDNFKINTFMTFGSPLGMPVIMSKISKELKKTLPQRGKLAVPEAIKRKWQNFSDLEDKVALNYDLSDDYASNSKGILLQDFVITNDYINKGERNPHKIYGYLRTPETARAILEFLESGKSRFRIWLDKHLIRFLSK